MNSELVILEYLHKSKPNNCKTTYNYAVELLKNNKVSEAKSILSKLLNPKYKDSNYRQKAIYMLGKIALKEDELDLAEEYFGSLPKDLYSRYNLAKVEYQKGNEDKAIKSLTSLIGTKLDFCARNALAIICIKKEEYREAFNHLYAAINNDTTQNVRDSIMLTLSKELNVFFNNYDYSKAMSYVASQVIKYDVDEVMRHISERHSAQFNNQINITELYRDIEKRLIDKNKINILRITDRYDIEYPNIGNCEEDMLRVITLPGTKKIITMFPYSTGDNETDEYMDELDLLEDDTEKYQPMKRKLTK